MYVSAFLGNRHKMIFWKTEFLKCWESFQTKTIEKEVHQKRVNRMRLDQLWLWKYFVKLAWNVSFKRRSETVALASFWDLFLHIFESTTLSMKHTVTNNDFHFLGACWEPTRTSKIELLGLTIFVKSSILDVRVGSEYTPGFLDTFYSFWGCCSGIFQSTLSTRFGDVTVGDVV